MSKKANDNVNLKIIAVETIDFSLNHIINNSKQKTTFHYNIKIGQKVSAEKQLIFIVPHVDIMHEDKETKLGSITISCVFEIQEFQDYYNPKTKQFSLSEVIAQNLNSVALSTCRGVMASQFKGTILQNAILPLIDIKKLTVE